MAGYIIETFNIALNAFFYEVRGRGIGFLLFLFLFAILLAMKFTYGRRVTIFEDILKGNDNSVLVALFLVMILNTVVCLILFYAIQVQIWVWLKISLIGILNIIAIPYILRSYADFEFEKFSDIFKITGYFILIFSILVFICGLIIRISCM